MNDGIIDMGKNVTPRYVSDRVRPQGERSIVYGNSLDANGRIGEPHGHTVVRNGNIDYARTMSNKILEERR